MPEEKIDRLGALNAYQIAGLSIVASTLAALAVLVAIRRLLFRRDLQPVGSTMSPAIDGLGGEAVPRHFSENIIVPGFTETGQEITEQDARRGRSPEGA